MKINILAVGTRGDLQPFIALAVKLKKKGYDVLVISSKNEKDFVSAYGLSFFPLDVDIQKLMEREEVQEMAKGNNPIKFFISHFKNSKNLKVLMIKTLGQVWEACQKADVIIYHPGMPIGFFIAKELDKTSILVNPFPVIPTRNYPSILFYKGPRLGKIYNSLTHAIFKKLFWSISKPSIEAFWKEHIHSNIDLKTPPIVQQIKSGMPVINAYSKYLFSHDQSWSSNIYTTGSLIIEEDSAYFPSAGLEKFIHKGNEPIYIGFGSMKDAKSFDHYLSMIIEAVSLTNQRAIVGLGWNLIESTKKLPDNIFVIENIPFSWLFPRVSAVVHHGGAGTTAAGLLAGKPTLIIPHHADQPAWGLRVFEMGVGAKPIPKAKLSSAKLASGITSLISPEIKERAQKLGSLLRSEGGVKEAESIIEEYIRSRN